MSSQIAALKNELEGCFEARRLDAHDSVMSVTLTGWGHHLTSVISEHTKGFSRRVCETLGLPPDTVRGLHFLGEQ
jgi:hypothetical protein